MPRRFLFHLFFNPRQSESRSSRPARLVCSRNWPQAAAMSWPFCISAAPAALDRYPRGLTGHVAHPSRSIETRPFPNSLAPTLVILPSMSLFPVAPFTGWLNVSFVAATDRKLRLCHCLSQGGGLRSHHLSAGWIEIFPVAGATDATIQGLRRCCTE